MEENNTQNNTKIAELEALLFYYGEPISIIRLSKLLSVSTAMCKTLVENLEEVYQSDARGLTVLKESENVQLVTKPSVKTVCEALVKEEFRETLTPAALETLSIIAYLGPIPRSTVDYIRGVNSAFSVRNLLMRGLIDRATDTKLGNAFLYRASSQFLSHMGLSSIEMLPEYEKFKNILKDFEVKSNSDVA